ncbi:ketosteroid isomerase-like protein [Allocatelliglobosispora scoriae]|uniref:Ketosteroid isomerase-like protein n=1 Tax=Allocatelliglobosispora scoriae TaxID=643052 RepID=A0A841BTB1_9ACTN|nr:nuclear transport factor 2 family protein [Allocatelliglobosispora scoriae]MBB5871444.1 ketosteroid isomerase-like protein [Allocatelliglobosispora scoriae]
MRKWYAGAMAALSLAVLLVVPGTAGAHGEYTARGCERNFDRAVAHFDAVFLAKDLPAVMSYYHDEAVQIGAAGTYRPNKAAIEANFSRLFTFDFIATFPEVKVIEGCNTATLVVDFTLTIPSVNVKQHFYNALTFVREHGKWKIVLDVSSPLPVV